MNTYTENPKRFIYFNGSHAPMSDGNKDYRKILQEVADGDAEIIPYIQDTEDLRKEKIAGIRDEAIRRVGVKVNVIKEIDMTEPALFSYQHAWPVAGASQELVQGKAVYDYAKTKLTQTRGADRSQLQNYDPVTDNNWP